MIDDLTQDEKRLANLMSALSEKCYSAGWMTNLEYVLWDAIVSGPGKYGQGKITEKDISQLIEVSGKTRSWIIFDNESEETAIPLDKWKARFAEDTRKNPDLLRR